MNYEVIAAGRMFHVYYGSMRVASCKVRDHAARVAELLNQHGGGGVSARAAGLAEENCKRDGISSK